MAEGSAGYSMEAAAGHGGGGGGGGGGCKTMARQDRKVATILEATPAADGGADPIGERGELKGEKPSIDRW